MLGQALLYESMLSTFRSTNIHGSLTWDPAWAKAKSRQSQIIRKIGFVGGSQKTIAPNTPNQNGGGEGGGFHCAEHSTRVDAIVSHSFALNGNIVLSGGW